VGNFIGTNAAGTAALGNDGGVVIRSGSDSTIGGTASGAGNRIAHKDRDGDEHGERRHLGVLPERRRRGRPVRERRPAQSERWEVPASRG